MMIRKLIALTLLLSMWFVSPALADLQQVKVAALPTSGPAGMTRIAADGLTEADCTVGGGQFKVLCQFDGLSTWAIPKTTQAIKTPANYGTTDLCTPVTGIIAQIASTVMKLMIDVPTTCPADAVFPSTLDVEVVPGGDVTMTTAKTLDIQGAFTAPLNQQTFKNANPGQGTVRFRSHAITALYGEYWGMKADASTNSGPPFRALLTAAKDAYRPGFGGGYAAYIQLLGGIYMMDSPGVHVPCFVRVQGSAVGGTQIQTIGSGNDYDMMTSDGSVDCSGQTYVLNTSLRDFKLVKVGGTTASCYIRLINVFQYDIRNISTSNSTGHGICVEAATGTTNNTVLIDHSEIGGAAANVGIALNAKNSNITELNVSHESFLTGIYCLQTGTVPCQITSTMPYFEGNTGTDVLLDASNGSTFTGPIHKTGNPTPAIGYSFVNGAHHNNIFSGNVNYVGTNGLNPPFKQDATSYANCYWGTNQKDAGTPTDQGICKDGISPLIANYQTTMTPDLYKYNDYRYTFDSGSAWTMNAPLNAAGPRQRMRFMFRNASGGAMGGATFNAVFKMPAFVAPANGFSRFYEFECDGTNCAEVFRSAADVPNS